MEVVVMAKHEEEVTEIAEEATRLLLGFLTGASLKLVTN